MPGVIPVKGWFASACNQRVTSCSRSVPITNNSQAQTRCRRCTRKRVPFLEVGPLGKKVSGAISKSDLKGRRRPGFGRKCSSYIRTIDSMQAARLARLAILRVPSRAGPPFSENLPPTTSKNAV